MKYTHSHSHPHAKPVHPAGHRSGHHHAHAHTLPQRPTLLAMPAWQRVLLVLPLIAALWLSAWWALS